MDYELLIKIVGAFGITLGLLLNWRTHSERSTFEMIDRLYSLCHTLEAHLLRDWRLSHLFCIGAEDYEQMRRSVAEGLTPEERNQFRVKEQMFAVHIFVVYEQVLYQWKSSSGVLHRRRRKFLQEMLSYFADRLLLNPRLQAFLSSDTSGLSLHLEDSSMDYLNKVQRAKVLVKPDFDGPFVPEVKQLSLVEGASNKSFEPTAS